MFRVAKVLLAAACLVGAACDSEKGEAGNACEKHSDCNKDLQCVHLKCARVRYPDELERGTPN